MLAVQTEASAQIRKISAISPISVTTPKGGNRPSANSHTIMGTLTRLISLIMLILAATTDA